MDKRKTVIEVNELQDAIKFVQRAVEALERAREPALAMLLGRVRREATIVMEKNTQRGGAL